MMRATCAEGEIRVLKLACRGLKGSKQQNGWGTNIQLRYGAFAPVRPW
jgi:hypothetical protein